VIFYLIPSTTTPSSLSISPHSLLILTRCPSPVSIIVFLRQLACNPREPLPCPIFLGRPLLHTPPAVSPSPPAPPNALGPQRSNGLSFSCSRTSSPSRLHRPAFPVAFPSTVVSGLVPPHGCIGRHSTISFRANRTSTFLSTTSEYYFPFNPASSCHLSTATSTTSNSAQP
jgi:hypothetical protein